MTTEEKAKAYDEALELARDYYKANLKLNNADENLLLEDIFPELAESEDERIRKRLIDLIYKVYAFTNYITCVEYENIIAWLEKQGDTTSDIRYDGVNAGASLSVVNGNSFDHEKATITQTTITQKDFAPKAEPKFKVGDMVCKKKDNSFCATINSITDTVYLCDVFDSDGDYDDDYAFLILEQDEYELVEKRVELTQSVTKKSDKVWSDEDDYNLQCMIAKVTSDIQKGNVGRNNELIDWLKSLKDRIICKNTI